MRKANKNVFIEGFKDPAPLNSLNDILLADLRGDGDRKLVLFDKDKSTLIVYRGISRAVQKLVEVKNVSHMISFYDEDSRMPQPCIALGAQNALYIFRNLQQSFRLKVPDVVPYPQQKTAWAQHSADVDQLTKELERIQLTKKLTQYGKYFVGATTKQRKQELLKAALEDGLVEKDAISCLGVIKQKDYTTVENVVICTQLKHLHILDNFGHLILLSLNLGFVGFQAFGEGQLSTEYTLVVVGRQELVAVIKNGTIFQKFSLPNKARSCSLDYPLLYVLTCNQSILCYDISGKHLKRQSFILPIQAIQIEAIRTRTFKALIVGCERQIRVYNESLLISKLQLDYPLQCFKFGTANKQQNCLVIVYKEHGFQVRIMHRQFNHNYKYEKVQLEKQEEQFPVPKITTLFAGQMKPAEDDASLHRLFQKDMKIMKWRTLTEQLKSTGSANRKLIVNSNIVGIGPYFVLKLEIQNSGEEALYNLRLCLSFDVRVYQIQEHQSVIPMVVPNFSYPISIRCKNISETGQPSNIHVVVTGPKLQPCNLLISMPQSQFQLT